MMIEDLHWLGHAGFYFRSRPAVPMHYGGVVGSAESAEEFRRLGSCGARILEKE